MKSYKNLSPIEKSVLLHELFPEEIAGFLNYSYGLADIILTNPGRIIGYSSDLLHSTGFWKTIVDEVKNTIKTFKNPLIEDPAKFSQLLFGNSQFIFSSYCLHQYTISGKCLNNKFVLAIQLLFLF